MHVWLINPYGPLPGEGWRDYRFTLIARALAARGHTATWFTATFDHYTKRKRTQASEGIELVPTPSYSRNVGVGRLRFEYIFTRNMERRRRELAPPDIIIAADPPQLCGAAGRRLAALHGVPFVLDCLDLWPELFINAAPRLLRPLVRAAVQPLFAMRRRNVGAAELVIAAAESYRRVLGARNAITIPIGVDLSAFRPREERSGRLTAIYAGTLGEAYDLITVIEAAAMLRDMDFVIAGRGSVEKRLRAKAEGVSNVRFVGSVDANALIDLYAQSDIGLAPYSAGSTVALPVKFFDYLAAGLPIVTSLSGEAAELAAARYEAGNAESLRDALRSLADDDRRRRLSEAARAASAAFDQSALYTRYVQAIEELR